MALDRDRRDAQIAETAFAAEFDAVAAQALLAVAQVRDHALGNPVPVLQVIAARHHDGVLERLDIVAPVQPQCGERRLDLAQVQQQVARDRRAAAVLYGRIHAHHAAAVVALGAQVPVGVGIVRIVRR
jgi:hypothetical protein